jgi:phosphotriesterase-related protein
MQQTDLVGKVQTVLGLIEPDTLGITLTHEHLLGDMSAYFVEPTEATERRMAHEPIKMENLWWLRGHSVLSLDNTNLTNEELAVKEASFFKREGGSTIVELSSIGLCRDPLGLARISRATRLNIIMGAGYYVSVSHPPELASKNEKVITEEIVKDILDGVGNTGVHAGIIGEIGCSDPLTETERMSLRASAMAQQHTGAPLTIHPSPNDDLALEIITILRDAGADLTRTIIDHVDVWNLKTDTCRKIADAGCYLEFDSLKTNAEIYPTNYLIGRLRETPSHLQVVNTIIKFIGEGYLNQILMTHDICMKHQMITYGGCGYAHILRNILPVMRYKGVTEEQIHTILVENPKRILQFAPAKG